MASSQYFIRNQGGAYFLTMTVVDWVDVFTRPSYRLLMVDSLRYCQQEKGLRLFAWCLMSNHLHLLAAAADSYNLSDILRDMKKFTSKRLVKAIQEEPESRRNWMLQRFAYAGKYRTNVKEYKFWQDGNHAKECTSQAFLLEKLHYIHQNPVRNLLVEEAEQYLFSSARNYAELKGLLEVEML
ncbi:transposase [Rhabdobacter roseus]|uniref:REP element-mobilizing transposase RayT n=1 Tax=Rhabdobacter roseus TaxID=1655419 RepID=A0A840TKY0_9BACT|nr:transposase [Rhabdobacter roseus]MBB5282222.1 REP element-mobilizing transposase RayT [Rhabdobacter roseus]